MDPRRILVLADQEKTEIESLVARIPGAREVIVPGVKTPDLPGIRIRVIGEGDPGMLAAESKATLIIGERDLAISADLLLVPRDMQEDTRQITDHLLIWVPQDRRSRQLITAFLDQVNPIEVHLLTEGEDDSEIVLHAPLATVSTEEIVDDPITMLARAGSIRHPSLIMVPRRLTGAEQKTILDSGIPVFIPQQICGKIEIRELRSGEFADANLVWIEYHETKGDPQTDRVFAAFDGELIISLARCRRHPDGCEVDAVYTPEPYRGRGFSRQVMGALVEACYNEELTMYAVQHLKTFYSGFGFIPIPEGDLPASVRERYLWAAGNLEGAEVIPMRRVPGRPPILTGYDTHK